MRILVSLFCGSLFGAGLVVSGMTDTTKVQGWLDLFGAWDPTLAFVLGGAIIPMAIAWRLMGRTIVKPRFADAFPSRNAGKIDRDVVVGSSFFGFGWALVGLCPGPAAAVLGYGGWPALLFFAAMLVGMFLSRIPSLRGAPA